MVIYGVRIRFWPTLKTCFACVCTCQACENAVSTLAGISTSEAGTLACLTHKVPRAVVMLARRGISGTCKHVFYF